MSKFVLKDCKDGLKVKSFKSLEKATKYVRENYYLTCDKRNIEESLDKVEFKEKLMGIPMEFMKSVGSTSVDSLVKKYNLEPVDDLNNAAVQFAVDYMKMPYLYVTTYDDRSITYGVRKTIKEVLELFLKKQQSYMIDGCPEGPYWFKVNGKTILSEDTPSWFKHLYKKYKFFDESFLIPYEG